MKSLYKKLNNIWSRFNTWGTRSFIGDIVVSLTRTVFFVATIFLVFYGLFVVGPFQDDLSEGNPLSTSSNHDSSKNESCNVAGINMHGTLITYIPPHNADNPLPDTDIYSSEYIVGVINNANKDENIKAILLEADSGGGMPVAGEEIAHAVKNSKKPVIAVIRGYGSSATYWAISPSDKIFASRNSEVGSIGVTSSYLNKVESNTKNGLVYEQISMGKYKDTGSPNKALTEEEKTLLMRDIKIMYNYFVEDVAKNRNLPVEKVKAIADGSSMLGVQAKEVGLIDEIGGLTEAKEYIEKTIGEKSDICWE